MAKRLTTEEFIEKAKKVHGDKYDYSKVEYINSQTKVCIICPIHGEFMQRPNDHLMGKGCKKCVTNEKKTTLEFINEAKKIHGSKYDYSNTEYISAFKKLCIICHKHGEFWQIPDNHLHGKGCPKCAGKNRTTDEIISSFKEVHGDRYDYSHVNFKNMSKLVCIKCYKHGKFWQVPNVHLNGCGCPKCGIEESSNKQRLGRNKFIEISTKIHGNKYDYSNVEYFNNRKKVAIICPKHGEFYQAPYEHLSGKGCKKCAHESVGEKKKIPFEEFVNRSIKIHGDKYEYHEETYVNASQKTMITCPKHGDFWQTADHHMIGYGCPFCNESKLERKVSILLSANSIEFERQHKEKWLGRQSLDFFIPKYNIAIECQGEQHYKPTTFGSMEKSKYDCFKEVKERDNRKKKLCDENGIKLLYFSDKKYGNDVIFEENNLIEKILNQDDI